MQNLSYENEFYLHVNENSFSYMYKKAVHQDSLRKSRVQDNSEMAYFPIQQLQSQCKIEFA